MKKTVLKAICSIIATAMILSGATPALAFISDAIITFTHTETYNESSFVLEPDLDVLYYLDGYCSSWSWYHSIEEKIIKQPTYFEEGIISYHCNKCGRNSEGTIPKLEYNTENPNGAGRVYFQIVDAQTKISISGIKFQLTSVDETYTAYSSSTGYSQIIVPAGEYRATVADGDMTRSFNITVREGDQTLPLIGISSKPLVEAKFSCKSMTIDEIKKAGIDITNPNNQHVYNYKIIFDFVADDFYLGFYFDKNGNYVGYSGEHNVPDGYEVKPGGGGSGGGSPYVEVEDLDTGDKKYIYPVNEHFYIVVHGNAKWLKEMFHVEMLVINNSLTDTVENCVSSIELPDGLSLAEMTEDKKPQSLTQRIDFIDYGKTHSFHWYIKGDKEGDYDIKGYLSGTLKPFGDKFNYTYSLESPIHVYAGKAIHMTIFAPVAAYHGEAYNFKIQFENVSDRPIYGFKNSITGISQYKRTIYSNGDKKEDELYSKDSEKVQADYLDTFYPGDKITIECSTNILFESEIVRKQLEGAVTGIEQLRALVESISAYNTTVDYITDTDKYFEALINNLNQLKELEENTEKLQAYDELLAASTNLYKEFSTNDKRALDIVAKLKISDFYDDLRRYAVKGLTLVNASAERINQIADGFTAIGKAEFELNVQVIDQIKAALCALPMRFILKNVSVVTLSGSTTEIPYSVELLPDTNENYSKVLHLTNTIKELITLYAGGLDAPRMVRYFAGNMTSDNQQVKFVDSTTFMSSSSSFDASFKVWVEEVNSEKTNNDFKLSSDAADSNFSNEHLTFTKSGNITVSAKEGSIGVLKIETTQKDGTTTLEAYMIESIQEHKCYGERREIIIPCDLSSDGIKAILCDECDSVIGTETYRNKYLGDVNDDGVVDIDDAVLIFGYDSKIKQLTPEQIERADTTDDGQVTAEDAMLILMDDESLTGNYTPTSDITRAVFVAVLYRMEGQPECSTVCNFSDVSVDSWYRNAIIWASENGIVKGITEYTFNPEGKITREQMAALMYRYANHQKAEIASSDVAKIFVDSDEVSDYAKAAVLWVASTGLMIGNTDGTFEPLSMATKEHTAIVLVRMMNLIK